ncbi:MAG: SAM-dependent methyltransferase [Acidimicrobiales bacterium]|nr:SAM-dependent methyltransferase [Acidimicrobiales bacterium]
MADYLSSLNTPPNPAQEAVRTETSQLPSATMRFNHEAAMMLQLIVRAQRPMFVVEVGTFTGYSSLTLASVLPEGGRMLCCDVSKSWTDVARRHWAAAGVDDRIELRIGPAIHTLRSLPAKPAVDFAIIDADKTGYVDYYEELVPRLSPHGLMGVDNTMWNGQVLDDTDSSEDTAAIRAFNAHVAADPRTINVTVPIGDGVTLIGLAG